MPLNNPATAGPTHQTDVTASRALDTVYQNTTGVPLYVAVTVHCQTGNAMETARVIMQTDSANPPTVAILYMGIAQSIALNPQNNHAGFIVVLPGNYYKAQSDLIGVGASVTLFRWIEWY